MEPVWRLVNSIREKRAVELQLETSLRDPPSRSGQLGTKKNGLMTGKVDAIKPNLTQLATTIITPHVSLQKSSRCLRPPLQILTE